MKRIERRAREAELAPTSRPQRAADFMANRPFQWAFVATLGVVVALALTAAFASISSVVFSVLAAAFITLGLDPLVRWFERRGMKRGAAIVTVIILFILVIAGMLWLVLPLRDHAGGDAHRISCRRCSRTCARRTGSKTPHRARAVCSAPSTRGSSDLISNPTFWATIGGGALNVGLAIVGGISSGFFIFILTIYFTATLDVSKAAIYTLISASHRERVVGYAERIMQNVGRYLSGMVVLAFFNATYSFILLLARAACRSHS